MEYDSTSPWFPLLAAAAAVLTFVSPAFAQSDAPEPPVAPATVARDATAAWRCGPCASRRPLQVDGRLDEAVYATVAAVSDLRQQDPQEGEPATEKTEFWVFFDRDRALRVGALLGKRHGRHGRQRDAARHNNIFQDDHVAFLLDTFHDRRNGVEFAINAIGGRWDGQISNESQINADWNPVYDLGVGRFEGGWSVELAIPFKSLRYGPGRAADVGAERPAHQPRHEERDVVPHPRAALDRRTRRCSWPRSRRRCRASRCRPDRACSR